MLLFFYTLIIHLVLRPNGLQVLILISSCLMLSMCTFNIKCFHQVSSELGGVKQSGNTVELPNTNSPLVCFLGSNNKAWWSDWSHHCGPDHERRGRRQKWSVPLLLISFSANYDLRHYVGRLSFHSCELHILGTQRGMFLTFATHVHFGGAKVKVIVTSRLSPSKECLNWISLHHKRPLGYKDELLRWLWPDKTLVSSMMNWWHFILKESKVSLLWTPNVLQKHFSGDYRQSFATARQ